MSETGVKKHVVRLSAEEREALEAMISKGKGPAGQLLKAPILLKADISDAGDGWSDERIVEALETSLSTVYRTRQLSVEDGLDTALNRLRKNRERLASFLAFDSWHGLGRGEFGVFRCAAGPKLRSRAGFGRTPGVATPRHPAALASGSGCRPPPRG